MKLPAKLLSIVVIGFGLIQLVPYGRSHTNPATTGTPKWDSPRTEELFNRACADCHSNNTKWLWFHSIAPGSWLVQHDVDEGRGDFNVSEWGRTKNEGDRAANNVRRGGMPKALYLPLHPEARLSATEKDELIKGLVATFGDKQFNGPPSN